MATYVIGDVQGCYQELAQLLERITKETPQAHFRFVGDLINRGPASLETLRLIRSLGDQAKCVLGNHDLHFLARAGGIRKRALRDTFEDVLQAPDCEEWVEWMRQLPLALFENGHLIVHAGVLPQWTAAQSLQLAEEVTQALQSPHWKEFLVEMYGNKPTKWNDNLSGMDRLRCIVNGLTRLRFCSMSGVMEFKSKEGVAQAPQGYMPWFEIPARKTQDVTVVFGHWSTLGLLQRHNLIALDTGCVWGGQLSAVRLEDRAVFQVSGVTYCQP